MQVKQKIYTPLKMVKGVLNAKQKDGNYFHAKNIRFNTHLEDAAGGFVFEKGNDVSFTLPAVTVDYANTAFAYTSNGVQKYLNYTVKSSIAPRHEIEALFPNGRTSNQFGSQVIIGYSITRDGLLLFSTDDKGFDCIWYIEDTEGAKVIELKFCKNLGFSKLNPIEAISNYENENIDKTYWIDGKNQQRSLNIKSENLADLSTSALDMVGNFGLSQIRVVDTFPGGTHTAGMIQYAYNLYRLNGSQTKLSPLTELVPLDKGAFGGGELNENVSKTVSLEVTGLDVSYSNIKIYAVKYTSFNMSPSISVVLDQSIPASGVVSYYDDGNVLSTVSSETFLFLGGEVMIPRSMNVKSNRMFLSNYTEKTYDLEAIAPGCRAFSYDFSGNCSVAESMTKTPLGLMMPVGELFFNKANPIAPHEKHSCLNTSYDRYKYNANSLLGGTGKFLEYTLTRSQVSGIGFTEQDAKGKFFKDGELYRISIQFYSKYGEVSTPKWIADFITSQTSQGNLSGYYATLEVKMLPAFYTYIATLSEDERPVGYKILRAERNIQDRTILAQGIINGTIAIRAANSSEVYPDFSDQAIAFCHDENTIKIPSMIRGFDDTLCPLWGNKAYFSVNNRNGHPTGRKIGGSDYIGNVNEIFNAGDGDDKRKQSYQFNKLMQFHCPEIEFDLLNKISSEQITVIGTMGSTENSYWGKEIHITTKNTRVETKVSKGISPFATNLPPNSVTAQSGSTRDLQDHGIVGPSGSTDGYDNHQFYREFKGAFTYKTKTYDIYGKPEIVERGQARRKYNRDTHMAYTNSLEPMSSDTAEDYDAIEKPGVDRVNSWVVRSAFFALGVDSQITEARIGIEDIFNSMAFQDKKAVLITEFKINPALVYLGNLYGGNSYEEKKRTNYIEIGAYKKADASSSVLIINNPGDTFVSEYKFQRISKTSAESNDCRTSHISEIVSYMTETSVDLSRRNDLSLTEWNSKFMPAYEDYKKYNRVYSQESNLIYRKNLDYNFRKVNSFETSIIATKEKLPNEPIDSWTDILVNEQIALDGRFGPINALVSFRDEIFAFQDRAVARISILPRVQISGNDGIAVQLGTGSLFNEYRYITTKSGSKNKWGIASTEQGIYYLDALNKTFCMLSGEGMKTISDDEGFHKEFIEMIDSSWIRPDNPLIKKGVSIGYDHITKDVYLSVFAEGKCTTISYNEDQKGFSSYYDYDAPIYIFNKKQMLTIHPGLSSTVMAHFTGEHNVFNGTREESTYAVIIAPEPMVECLFNNLQYNTLAKDKQGVEVLNTWETIRAYNEFQDSGIVALVDRKNIRKKNRQHNITIPRQANSRHRIRNNWAIIELKAANLQGNSVVMHDMVLSYSPNYTVVL